MTQVAKIAGLVLLVVVVFMGSRVMGELSAAKLSHDIVSAVACRDRTGFEEALSELPVPTPDIAKRIANHSNAEEVWLQIRKSLVRKCDEERVQAILESSF